MKKITITGTYKSGGELVDYSNEVIETPDFNEELKNYVVQNRYLKSHFEKSGKRFDGNDRCYIDKIVKGDKLAHRLSGLSIKELDWKQLQDFATYFELNEVPLYRDTDVRYAQQVAYRAYCNKYEGTEYNASYDFANAPDVLIPSCESKSSKSATAETFKDDGL